MKLLGIEMPFKEFDNLMREQSKGKELKVVDGKVVAVEHKPTQKEILQNELLEIKIWFAEYDNQVKQYERCQRLGITFDKDINLLDNEAREKQQRIAEIRNLLKGDVNGN